MELKTKIYTIFTALLIFRFSPLSQAQAFNCRDLVGGGAVVTVAGMVMLTLDMMEKYNSYQSKPTLSAFDRCEIDCYCKKYVKHKIFGTRYLCTELCNDEDALLEFINPVYWPILSGDLEEFHKIANFEKFNPQEDQFILEHSGRSVPKKVMQKYISTTYI